MCWKLILVNLLLVASNCWNFTSGEYYDLQDDHGVSGLDISEENMRLDKIMSQLMQDQIGKDTSQDFLDKKDLNQVTNVGSRDNGILSKSHDPSHDKTKDNKISPDNNNPPAEHNDKYKGIELAAPGQASALQQQQNEEDRRDSRIIKADDKQFIIIVAVAVSTSFVGLMLAGVCYYKFRKGAKAASDVEYPVYGVTGPVKERIPSPGDRKLAQSAQMYHYQHQKQQMIAMEKANGDMKHDASDDESEEDNIEGDYTVYECPGLAPTGEMEVRNPLFRGDDTPVTPGEDITGQPHGEEPERGN